MIDGLNAAYPQIETNDPTVSSEYGLTKREYFAAKAMQGLLGNRHMVDDMSDPCQEFAATEAVAMADMLLAALEMPLEKPTGGAKIDA